jgi:hypothetical protein
LLARRRDQPVIIYEDDWCGARLGEHAVLLVNSGGPPLVAPRLSSFL